VKDIKAEVRRGLTATPKWLSPVWFYDERGSQLFDEITRLPEYYPTRTERAILLENAGKMAAMADAEVLVELGSGTSEKTRILLDAMRDQGSLRAFVPFDVSEETLLDAAAAINVEYPGVEVHAVVGDFHLDLGLIPRWGRQMIAFLGGTIGNLIPEERTPFLSAIAALLEGDDTFLLGTDLVKDPARLVAAYDDAAGVTAEFNRNVLRRLNAELGADFDLDRFQHIALWNDEERWIEMRLRSFGEQHVHIEGLDLDITFAEGEDLLTEISAKFTPDGIADELEAAGLSIREAWTDPAGDFQLTLAGP
jgi:L-histidine N-alpha-methyltransferase